MGLIISNGRPEDKELTRKVEALKKEYAEKRQEAALQRTTGQSATR